MNKKSPKQVAEELGERLKRARLNRNMTQIEVAQYAGISRNAVAGAEHGRVQLETFVAILRALNLLDQLNSFLPAQPLSPIQLAKLHGKVRQRASGLDGVEKKIKDSEW